MRSFILPNRLFRILAIAVAASLISSPRIHAQVSPPATLASHAHPPNPTPVNLHVLPKDLSRDALHELMHGYSAQLGVQCSYCHAPSSTGKGLDFASDSKPAKTTARHMISMAEDINTKYLAKTLPTDTPEQVACGTCHRGHAKPETFVPPPHEHEGH